MERTPVGLNLGECGQRRLELPTGTKSTLPLFDITIVVDEDRISITDVIKVGSCNRAAQLRAYG